MKFSFLLRTSLYLLMEERNANTIFYFYSW